LATCGKGENNHRFLNVIQNLKQKAIKPKKNRGKKVGKWNGMKIILKNRCYMGGIGRIKSMDTGETLRKRNKEAEVKPAAKMETDFFVFRRDFFLVTLITA